MGGGVKLFLQERNMNFFHYRYGKSKAKFQLHTSEFTVVSTHLLLMVVTRSLVWPSEL